MRLSDQYNVAEFRTRALVLAVFFSCLLSILVVRLWFLQIWQGEMYREFSDQNRFKIERLFAPRGSLFDRKGVLLADTRPRFDAIYTRGDAQALADEFKILADVFQWESEESAQKLERVKKSPRYQGVTVAQDISRDQLSLLQMKNLDLPGLDIEVRSVRDYLFGDAFFHVIGYTGEIGERDLKRLQERYPERSYTRGDQRGIIGIESLTEGVLRGKDGRNFLVVDVKGRKVLQSQWNLLPEGRRVDPVAGESLRLSLDVDLQLEAIKAMGDKVGSVVALDPQTGEILAYVSRPGLDPNLFSRVLTTQMYRDLTNQPENPFLDRVVGEHYPPGSTLKLIMAMAALENGVIDDKTTYYCPGSFRFGRRVWGCHKRAGHGRINVVQAIEQSCDVFFYNAGLSLGLDAMFSWSVRFGFGRRTFLGSEVLGSALDRIFRFNSEQPGFIPYEDWIKSRKNTTVEAETINAGIGQGAFLVTALQLVRMTAALGNGGKIWQPQVILGSEKDWAESGKKFSARVENRLQLEPTLRALVLKGMQEVIEGSEGTARLSKIPHVQFGGKTGTAQVVQLDVWKKRAKHEREFEDHALFVGLAPLDNPQIAVAVIIEHGGHGSGAAAPVAKKMVDFYLNQRGIENNGIR